MASSSTPARRRRGGFGRFFLIWCLALALIGVLVLAKLWHSLSQYEKNSPEAAVTDFLQNIASADEEQLLQGSGFSLSPYERPGAYGQAMQELFADIPADRDQLRFSKQLTGNEGTVKVIASSGSVQLELRREEEGEPWQVIPPSPQTLTCTLLAPAHVSLSVNGKALPSQEAVSSRAAEGYEELPTPPQVLEYRLEGLVNLPEVEASLSDGTSWKVEVPEAQVGQTSAQAAAPVPADQQPGLESFARSAAQTYVRYVSRDADFSQVDAFLWPNTTLRETVRTLDNYWYTDHVSSSFENEEFLGSGSLGPDCCWIELKMDYRVNIGYKQVVLPVHYRMYAALSEGNWKLVSMESL